MRLLTWTRRHQAYSWGDHNAVRTSGLFCWSARLCSGSKIMQGSKSVQEAFVPRDNSHFPNAPFFDLRFVV